MLWPMKKSSLDLDISRDKTVKKNLAQQVLLRKKKQIFEWNYIDGLNELIKVHVF